MEKKYIGYGLLTIAGLLIFVTPAILLWKESFRELGLSFWKVQLGWLMICGVSMFVLQDKNTKGVQNR